MNGVETALQAAIYVNIPLMGFVALTLYSINSRLAVVENTLKHLEERLKHLEGRD